MTLSPMGRSRLLGWRMARSCCVVTTARACTACRFSRIGGPDSLSFLSGITEGGEVDRMLFPWDQCGWSRVSACHGSTFARAVGELLPFRPR